MNEQYRNGKMERTIRHTGTRSTTRGGEERQRKRWQRNGSQTHQGEWITNNRPKQRKKPAQQITAEMGDARKDTQRPKIRRRGQELDPRPASQQAQGAKRRKNEIHDQNDKETWESRPADKPRTTGRKQHSSDEAQQAGQHARKATAVNIIVN